MNEEIAPGIYPDETEEHLIEGLNKNWHRLLRGSFVAVVFMALDAHFDFWLWGMVWGGAAGHALGGWWSLRYLSRRRSLLRST